MLSGSEIGRTQFNSGFAYFQPLKKITINSSRRYLGNKQKLLNFIKNVVDKECKNVNIVADVFAGTGSVASAFMDKKLITNDILYSNFICHTAWFSDEKYDVKKITDLISYYNSINPVEDNYMSETFGDTYFSKEDCRKIGFIREDIEQKFINDKINERERALLITSLIYAMDKIAKTCGHYDAYRKNVTFDKKIELAFPMANNNNKGNCCYNEDANVLVTKIKADLVYIDPPYNSRQYCDAYHLLENVARWEKPEVSGVALKMKRNDLKSKYCSKTEATIAFKDLIEKIDSKYILFSYNNMGKKGNDRSNARITDEEIMKILSSKGEVKIFSEKHKAFSAGLSDIDDNEERLFLCICKNKKKHIQSPLNYTGGKYKLLPQIMPLFPKDIDTFIDIFCGGANVGINAQYKKLILNDIDSNICGILKLFQKEKTDSLIKRINAIISKYNLSDSEKNGYEYYSCNSYDGLSKFNKTGFNQLKNEFNKMNSNDTDYYLMLFVLIVYSFNNQIRFNSKGEFNLPVGKRDFNNKMKQKLKEFMERIKGNVEITSCHFTQIKKFSKTKKTFVYADPPYLITCATYNENGGWNEEKEIELLNYLDYLDNNNVNFALSNVISCNGKTNEILSRWINKNKHRYIVHHLNMSYSNSNYHKLEKKSFADEVLITNYGV